MTTGRFEEPDKAVGMTFDADSLVAGKELWQHVKPYSSTAVDWMHNLLVHGISNLQVHAVLTCCKQRLGLNFADIHVYASDARLWQSAQEGQNKSMTFLLLAER